MSRHCTSLPQLQDKLFLTDGGIETTLIFHEGLDLPHFAAFHLLRDSKGQTALRDYFRSYTELAKQFETGLILESATWRASKDWGERLGYSAAELAAANKASIRLLEEIRNDYESVQTPVVISGCVGPRGDGYVPSETMSVEQAKAYHSEQIATFSETAADMVCAITMNYAEEATGIAIAAKLVDMPVAISFTVETDGCLPTGQELKEAIEQVDTATSNYPAYFMINCAHPTHFAHLFNEPAPWHSRIRGLRANASRMSHAELNEAPKLDAGDPEELGRQYANLRNRLTHLNVLGGCCGTDHRHIESIATACAQLVP